MSTKQHERIESAQRVRYGSLLCIPSRAATRNDDGTPRTKQQMRMAQRVIDRVMQASR